jgi:outer membrane protein TolC
MITRFNNYLLIVLALLLTAPAYARSEEAGVKAMSLQDCIDYAMKHADTIKNARLNVQRQNAQNNQIRALALPRVNGTGQLTYYPYQQQTLVPGIFGGDSSGGYIAVPFTPRWGANIGLSASQPVFDGTLLVALKARNTIMEVARQAEQLTKEGLKYQIQRAFYAIIIGQEQSKIVSDALLNARDASHDVEVLYNTGFAEKIDVDRSHVQLTNLETDSLRIAGLLETGEQALKFIIGMDINQEIALVEPSLEANITAAAELLTEQLDYTHRTEYNLLNTTLKLDESQLKRYQLAAYPSLSLFANSGYNYGSNNFSDLTNFHKNYLFSTLVGLQVNVPIFNGLLRQNQVQEARINVEKTKNNIHQLKLALDFQAAQSQTTLKNSILAAEKQRRNLQLSNTVLDLARKKYKAGVGSNQEVTLAQIDLLTSQNNYFSALLDLVNAQADVQRALGQFQ